jgi:LysM repeat protein
MGSSRLVAALAALAAAGALPAEAAAFTNAQIPGLQVALRAQGVYGGPIDGIAGPQTAAGVRAFQRLAKLPVDGLAGRRTRIALGPLGQPLFGRRVIRRGAVGWDVSVLQFLLRQRGLNPGAIDGRFGQATRRALRRFQRRAGLVVDGLAGPATIAAIDSSSSHVPIAAPARPPERRYRVRPGDSLTAIASRFGTTVAALARRNRLDPSHYLLVGTRLRVPTAAAGGRHAAVEALIDRWAAHYGVDARLARAVAWQESGYQQRVVSHAGAHGVMQVTNGTWDFVETVLLGRRVARTTEGNIRVGTAFLSHLLRRFAGDERLAVGAYFQGARSVRRHGLFRETERYVANVLALKVRV